MAYGATMWQEQNITATWTLANAALLVIRLYIGLTFTQLGV